jgi:glutamyl-tRNA reductase
MDRAKALKASNERLIVAGISHHCADVRVRERVAVPAWQLPEALADFKRNTQSSEVAILSTCNRTEIYLVADAPAQALLSVSEELSRRSRLEPDVLGLYVYAKQGIEAVAHLLRVSAGLDSMILGESEIAVQVKQAYAIARESGTTGPVLNRLFQKAAHTAKLARARTGIAQGHASIGSIVVDLARDCFGQAFSRCEALLWGSGKAAEATARHLIDAGIAQLWIVNRTPAKAQELAGRCSANWLSWEQAQSKLERVDIAVVCTQAPHYVIDQGDVARLSAQRQRKPLVLVDLSVPRNVDPSIREIPGIRLYDMDDLQAQAAQVWGLRAQAAQACESIIEEQTEYFLRWNTNPANREGRSCRIDVLC